ncbi:MAG: Trk system potassium transporter TrkA [Clostridia bacterium]|nr:Trk system potassium transporter TrkA [Clostridia bacterium]
MKIIIVGCGKVGRTIAEQLNNEKHDITVIDNRESVITRLTDKLDIMGIDGDGASLSNLHDAGVSTADLLIAVTDADELNLYICLLAKCCGTKNTIARVRKPVYHKDLQESAVMKNALGLSLMINPEQIAALEISNLIRFPTAIEVDTFARGNVQIYTFKLNPGSSLVGKKVSDLSSLKGTVRICDVERDDNVTIPGGNFVLSPGDKVSIICEPNNAAKFFKKITGEKTKSKDVMILGGSRTAYYLADLLLQNSFDVKIIEKDPKRCNELSDLLPNAMIICGDAMNQDLLNAERFEKMSSIVSLMDLDEENIMTSLYARQRSKAKCITKIDRIVFDNIVDTLPLDSVVRPRELTAEHIVRYVRAVNNSMGSNVETLYKLNDGKTEALEFKVSRDSSVISKPLKLLKFKSNLQVACITRRGKIIIPNGDDTIEPDDTVIIVTTHHGLQDLDDIIV